MKEISSLAKLTGIFAMSFTLLGLVVYFRTMGHATGTAVVPEPILSSLVAVGMGGIISGFFLAVVGNKRVP